MGARKKPEAAEVAASEEPKVDARGEISVMLDGQHYVLRPSREAITKIERQTRPLFALVQSASAGMLPIEEMAVCVVEMMKAYGAANPKDELALDYNGANAKAVADLIYEGSPFDVCRSLFAVLQGAVFGGYTASGEVKPATTETT